MAVSGPARAADELGLLVKERYGKTFAVKDMGHIGLVNLMNSMSWDKIVSDNVSPNPNPHLAFSHAATETCATPQYPVYVCENRNYLLLV